MTKTEMLQYVDSNYQNLGKRMIMAKVEYMTPRGKYNFTYGTDVIEIRRNKELYTIEKTGTIPYEGYQLPRGQKGATS